mmetsp:Transcript_91550/g.112122  ORF Transcript_91550/g.112122 Transcript_91550/m.112122 type:complete len:230 (+) Transcript_91550:47-736(+)
MSRDLKPIISVLLLLVFIIEANMDVQVFGTNDEVFTISLSDGSTKLIHLKEKISEIKGVGIQNIRIKKDNIDLDNNDMDLKEHEFYSVSLEIINPQLRFLRLSGQLLFNFNLRVFNYGAGTYTFKDGNEGTIDEDLGVWEFKFSETPQEMKRKILDHYGIKDAGVQLCVVKDDEKIIFGNEIQFIQGITENLPAVKLSKFPDGYRFFLVLLPDIEYIKESRIFRFAHRI